MPAPLIDDLPTPPLRSDEPAVFNSRAEAWVAAIDAWTTQANALAVYLEGLESGTLDPQLLAIAGLAPSADQVAYFTGLTAAALMTVTSAARGVLDDATVSDMLTSLGLSTDGKSLVMAANFAAMRTALSLGTAALLAETTSAEFRNNTADRALSTDQVWGAAAPVTLTPGTNVAVDLNSGINFTLAMGGNYTLDSPSNEKVGQSGFIQITQDGTGSRTLGYGSEWKFAGGTDPVLSTAASSVDVLFYQVLSSSNIFANLVKAVA